MNKKDARAEVHRLRAVASRLMDLIMSLDERRKDLVERIAELEIMREQHVSILQARFNRENHWQVSRRADQEQTGI